MKPIVELWAPVLINHGIFKDDYVVSNMGRVREKHTDVNGVVKYIPVNIIQGKRPMVKMYSGGQPYSKSIAKLVLSSFHWRDDCECANITYLDGNMKNCELSNLRYTADKGVYTLIELENKAEQMARVRRRRKPVVRIRMNGYGEPRSCKTCENCPCFSGMESLTSDFGAEGCNGYKPKLNN